MEGERERERERVRVCVTRESCESAATSLAATALARTPNRRCAPGDEIQIANK